MVALKKKRWRLKRVIIVTTKLLRHRFIYVFISRSTSWYTIFKVGTYVVARTAVVVAMVTYLKCHNRNTAPKIRVGSNF